jgi:SH3-like domain-containing protein
LSTNAGIKPVEAEKLKRKIGFSKGKTELERKVLPALTEAAKPLIKELKKTIAYYHDELGGTIGSVVIAGGSALLPGIDTFISTQLSLPVVCGNPAETVADTIGILKPKSKALLFANVLGLGLRACQGRKSRRDINLLPTGLVTLRVLPEVHNAVQWRSVYRLVGVLVSLFLLFALVLILQRRGVDVYRMIVPRGVDSSASLINQPSIDAAVSDITTTRLDETQPHIQIKSTDNGTLSVYGAPTSTASTTSHVVSGERYALIANQDDWFEIRLLDATTGWVSGSYIEVVVPLQAMVATSTPIGDTPTITPEVPVVLGTVKIRSVSLGYVNIRQGAGTNFAKIGEARVGAEYEYWQEANGWFEIQLDDTKRGWVIGTYVDKLP